MDKYISINNDNNYISINNDNSYISINNDNIIDNSKNDIIKLTLVENKNQLSDAKKRQFGFDLTDSVIDVNQDGYSICYEDDILYTYGIGPCCGLALCDENVRMLFHLDGTVTPQDVLDITDKVNLSQNTRVIVIPGASCGIDESFNYKQIEEDYKKRGYDVMEQRIPVALGFVTLDSDKIIIGTVIDRNIDIVLPISKGKKIR